MTKSEFRAWFDGFCEGMDGAPNEKQWERIKARVAEIDDKVVSYPVYIDRYVEPYRRYWPNNVPYWGSPLVATCTAGKLEGQSVSDDLQKVYAAVGHTAEFDFDSLMAMKAAGAAEYKTVLNS
jgi:hypothetical protein